MVPAIGNSKDSAPPPAGVWPRLSAMLVSPRGIMLAIPLLVGVAGLFILVSSDAILRRSLDELAAARFADQCAHLAEQARLDVSRAEAKLNGLHAFLDERGPGLSREILAKHLLAQISNNPGIAYISVSRPDGTFQGVYHDPDGKVLYQESGIGGDGATTNRRYTFSGDGSLVLSVTELATGYDPRQRPFYRLALERRRRAWTEPYQFYRSTNTGVTCVEPWYDNVGTLRGVLTVDFDLDSLSRALAQLHAIHGSRSFVFLRGGTLLAFAGEGLARPQRQDASLSAVQDFHDPLLEQLLAKAGEDTTDPQRAIALTLAGAGGGTVLAQVLPIPVGQDLLWYLGSYAPQEILLGPTLALRTRGVVIALAALLVAGGIGALFARHLVRARQDRAVARAAARKAEAQVRELGAYRLLKKLGEGGMGEVWRAEHRQLARPAAIKLMRREPSDSTSAEAKADLVRFENEAQAIASLRSRNTICLYDYGVSADGALFYVMELLDGLDLENLVQKFGAQPAGRAVAILVQACASLAEAHERGLIHRDIKPANIYLCRQADEVDVVKVLDFGLVISNAVAEPGAERLTKAGIVYGTPACMAPEQAQGEPLDGRADIYALGCVAWWLLTGKLLFDGDNGMQTMIRHIKEQPPALAPLCPKPPPTLLVDIVMSCLAKNPHDRPADARSLAIALAAVDCGAVGAWSRDEAVLWWSKNVPVPDFSTPAAASTAQEMHRRLETPEISIPDGLPLV